MDDSRAIDPSADGVEAALRLGFGGAPASQAGEGSVLRALDRLVGEAPRRLLREEDPGDAGSPLVTGAEDLGVPPGRGRYRVVGELARGGMGVILKGHDEDLCRDVALKVLSRRLAEDPALISRFVEEAQVGGQLQHPGIVPVYELGMMADGQPYIAMKLVKGRTLSNLLSERESPSAELRRFLGIFEQVCQTMAYAHSRGVIHRDLKPANVMVGAFGEVQVVDWGLSKVLRAGGTADEKRAKRLASEVSVIETVRSGEGSGGSASRVGSVMGTPAYMSPEQARGEVESLDERTDVFALGAVLCEVLTGRPPYGGGEDETVLEAAEARLEGARERLATCGADVELVELCERCLRPARATRPRNAEAVAREVGEYLASVEERAREAREEAAVARGRAVAERKARWLTVALSTSVLLAGLGGVVGWRSIEERERTRRERVAAEVQAALDEATAARGEERLVDALSAARRAESLAVAEVVGGGLEERARALSKAIAVQEEEARAAVERAAREARFLVRLERVRLIEPHDPLEEFEPGREGSHAGPVPLTERERADKWARRGAAYAAVFAEHGLDPDMDDEQLVERIAAGDVALETALALDDWAQVLRQLDGRDEEARRLLELAKSVDSEPWRGRMRDALLQDDDAALLAMADDPRALELPSASLYLLGQLLVNEGHPGAAAELLAAGVEAHSGDFALRHQLGRSLQKIDPPRLEAAVRHYTAARALRPDSVLVLGALGKTRRQLGEFDASRVILERAVQLDPENTWLLGQLARTLRALGDHPAALATQREAIRLDPDTLNLRWELVNLLYGAGELESALEQAKELVRLRPDNAWARAELARALTRAGDPLAGLAAAREATELDPAVDAGPHVAGHALLELGRYDEALQAFREAGELASPGEERMICAVRALRALGRREDAKAVVAEVLEGNPDHLHARLDHLALVHDEGRLEEAEQLARGILIDHPDEWGAMMILARIKLEREEFDGVVGLCEEILEKHPSRAETLEILGIARYRLGDTDAAFELLEQALELSPYSFSILKALGHWLSDSGRARDSLEFIRRGLELAPEDQELLSTYCAALSNLGEAASALEVAELAHSLDPDHVGNARRLGRLLQRNGEYSRAVEHLSRAVEQDPEHLGSWEDLGKALDKLQRWEEAILAFERVQNLDPRHCLAYHRLAALYLILGDHETAEAFLREGIEVNPGCSEGYKGLADFERERGNFTGAADLYRQALKRRSRASGVLFDLAWLLLASPGRDPHDPAEALELAERLIEIDPAAGYAWNTLGVAHYRLGDHSGAIEALERSVELGAGDARARLFLAMSHHQLDQEEEARAEFECAHRWLAEQSSVDEELAAVEREARELLGIPAEDLSDR